MIRHVGVMVVALIAALAGAPTSHAWGEYLSLSPGAHLVSTALSDEGFPFQCTAGWAVTTSIGSPGFIITAGHCRLDSINNSVLQRTPDGDKLIGYYTKWEIAEGVDDAAFIDLMSSDVPVSPELDGRRVAKVATANDLRASRPELCKSGSRTGLSCGPIVNITNTQVSFRAWDDAGDSGSPVYSYLPDGSIVAVGVLFGHNDDLAGRVIYASLLSPVLAKWNLTLTS